MYPNNESDMNRGSPEGHGPMVPAGFLFSKPQYFLALGFGAGLVPWMPGTAGALVGFLIYLITDHLVFPWQAILLGVMFVGGCYFCHITGRALGHHDHGVIVWDEVCAMAATLALVPATVANFVAAFVLFRVIDIWKPWPIRRVETRLQNGLGVMFDDLIAAAYTVLTIGIANQLFS